MFFNAYPFTMGVASGDPLPDGVVLWTRLAPRPLDGGGMPMVPMTVQWEVGGGCGLPDDRAEGETLARPELGHSVHVEVTGLEPGREYWYRFRAGNEISQIGRTKTAPAAGAPVDRLRFGVCGCSHYETGYFTGYRRIAQEQFDFVIHTGDYIYESRADGGRNENRVRQHHGTRSTRSSTTATATRVQVRSGPDGGAPLGAVHRQLGRSRGREQLRRRLRRERHAGGDLPAAPRRGVSGLLRAHAARMPSFPSGPHMRIYRRLLFGSLLDLSVLDTRQWRSDQACNDGTKTCPASLDPARTILGAGTGEVGLRQSRRRAGRWTVLSQQVYSFARDFVKANPDARFNMDVWDGYPAARQRLYSRIKETKAPIRS